MYTDTGYNVCIYTWRISPAKNPLLILVSTYLAPSSCDRNRPPRSQVARKLLPLVPHCSLAPFPPNSQPSSGFPEPNVHLIRRIANPFPSIQNTNISYPCSLAPATNISYPCSLAPATNISYPCSLVPATNISYPCSLAPATNISYPCPSYQHQSQGQEAKGCLDKEEAEPL
jgi:hypothetical protein